MDFPFENAFCTKLVLDKYDLSDWEKLELRKTAEEIAQKPMITIPDSARSIWDFSEKDFETIRRLDKIFWNDIIAMNIGRIITDVTTIGGEQKAEAVKEAAKRACMELHDVVYVGDSITDMEAFKLVRDHGGLTLSFNGNQYAVRSAEIAIMSESSLITAFIADLFGRYSKEAVLEIIGDWKREALMANKASESIVKKLLEIHSTALPKVKIVTPENEKTLVRESSDFRKRVRGQSIGRLG
jgi:energy-converting hydrogenase A subunit R